MTYPSMTYLGALDWLYALDSRLGMDFRLQRLEPVLASLGEPQRAFPAVHVAGTNGKGSTAANLHSVYREAGYTVGLYTSPHLLCFRERVRIGAAMISQQGVVDHLDRIRRATAATGVDLTFFEIATLMAFLEFRVQGVDLAIVEVGLGGRLDATNVVRTVCAAITSIGHDHCAYLGDTLARIAWEKAGIIREGVPVVTGELPAEATAVVAEVSAERRAPWLHYGRDFGPRDSAAAGGLLGDHQRCNAAVAAAVVGAVQEDFPVSCAALEQGIARTRWPGRLERLSGSPATYLDGAHNPQAASCLREALEALGMARPAVLVFGAMRDKDWREMLCRLLPIFDDVVLVPVEQPRTFDPAAAAPLARGLRPCTVARSALSGLQSARRLAGDDGTIVVTGSIFLVAELYRECGGDEDLFGENAAG